MSPPTNTGSSQHLAAGPHFPQVPSKGSGGWGGLRAEPGQQETIQGCPRRSHHKTVLIHSETRGAPVHPSRAPALLEGTGDTASAQARQKMFA